MFILRRFQHLWSRCRGGHSGARYPENQRFTGILANELKGEWEFIVEAKAGRCIPSMDFELEEFEEIIEKAGRIDLLAIMLGTNDYLSYSKPDADRAAGRMKALIDKLFENEAYSSRKTDILLIAPPKLDFTGDRYYEKFSTLMVAYLRLFIRWQMKRECILLM